MAAWRQLCFLGLGMKDFTAGGYKRHAKAGGWDAPPPPDALAGKTVVVTGANAGLGLELSRQLAARGATVVMACRDAARGEAAAAEVRAAASAAASVRVAVCDVASLASVRDFVQREFEGPQAPLHALVNNAGVLPDARATTPDGREAAFATNTLGTWQLTRALEAALRRGAPSRVIFVSSGGALRARLEVDAMEQPEGAPYDGVQQYSEDKRRQVALAELLARRWGGGGGGGIFVASCHPGWVDTPGVRTSLPAFHKAMASRLRTPAQGADTVAWLVTADAAALVPGGFYLDRAPRAKHLPGGGTTYAATDVARLAEKLDAMAGLESPPGGWREAP